MNESANVTNLLKSLVSVQAELPTMPKDCKGYGYTYTALDTIVATLKPILAKHGIAYMQPLTTVEGGRIGITTRIFNAGGEYIEDTAALPDVQMAKTNEAQNLGAAITYMRRYTLCSMLGITSDEDVDGEPRQRPQPNEQPLNSRQTRADAQTNGSRLPQQAGGPDTPQEKAEINALIGSTHQNGAPVFTRDEINQIPSMRMRSTAAQVIAFLKSEISRRRAEPRSKNQPGEPASEFLF